MVNKETIIKVLSVARFFFGLAILALTIYIPILAKASPIMLFVAMVAFPLCFVVPPIMVIAGYFLFTSKFRWRIDVVALFLLIIEMYLYIQVAFPNPGGGGGM